MINHVRHVAAVGGFVEDHGMWRVPHCLLLKYRTAEARLMRIASSALLSEHRLSPFIAVWLCSILYSLTFCIFPELTDLSGRKCMTLCPTFVHACLKCSELDIAS